MFLFSSENIATFPVKILTEAPRQLSKLDLCRVKKMAEEELDDVPPSLVSVEEAGDTGTDDVEAGIEDLNVTKVPITIVTGQ